MRKFSKILVLMIFALCLIMAIAACGDNADNPEVNNCIVSFNTDGGSSVDIQTIDKGGRLRDLLAIRQRQATILMIGIKTLQKRICLIFLSRQ